MTMQHKSFTLDPGGPRRLHLSWETAWNSIDITNITVRLDDQLLGSIPTKAELLEGRSFQLPDGSALLVQWADDGRYQVGWRLLRDGQPILGSLTDPFPKIDKTAQAVFWVAGINLVVGLASLLSLIGPFNQGGRSIGVSSIVYGLIFVGLGFLVRRQSLIALLLAIALHSFDILSLLLFGMQRGINGTFLIGIALKLAFLVSMIRGVQPIRSVKR